MEANTIFRFAMVLELIAYQIPRTLFRKKAKTTRTEAGQIGSEISESKWRLVLMGITGLGTNLVGLIWIINPAWLYWSNLDFPLWLRWIGAAVGVVTVVMSYFVHKTLGRNFTPTLETPEGSQLVTEGIYAYIRHPMYTTYFLLYISSFLMSTNWLIAIFGLIYSLLIVNRVMVEEIMMIKTYGDDYREYMQQSGRFFPSIFANSRLYSGEGT